METSRRKFIVIEGSDGSGKTEQVKKLLELLRARGFDWLTVDFPQYDRQSAHFVKRYLKGDYGSVDEVSPEKASIFYALDRFDASPEIRRALGLGMLVVANRYVASNLAHQGAKIKDLAEREKFFKWEHELEYGIFGIPKPDINIVLHVPAETSFELASRRDQGKLGYLEHGKKDIHEGNLEYLRKAEAVYLHLVDAFPEDFVIVECAPGGKLLSLDEIHEKIWAIVEPILISPRAS